MLQKTKRKKDEVWFLDMDGTIAEWRTDINDYTELKVPGYYKNLAPTGFLLPFRQFVKKNPHRLYILSSYLPDCSALEDKKEWLKKYFPEIRTENQLFVPYGESKADFVIKSFHLDELTENLILFDDYSQNLHEWQAAGGTGIKCYNGINGNNGTWKGNGAIWSFQVREFLGLTEQKKSPYYHGQLLIDQSDINVKYCIQ